MKTKILMSSVSSIVAATTVGIYNALFGTNPELVTRWTAVAGILVAASIGLFFVGLVYPKETNVNSCERKAS